MRIVLIILFIASISPIYSQNEIDINRISKAEKIYGLSKFWKEAKYNFAYFDRIDIDWDQKYSDLKVNFWHLEHFVNLAA